MKTQKQKLAYLYQKLADTDNGCFEYLTTSGWIRTNSPPALNADLSKWRIAKHIPKWKPKNYFYSGYEPGGIVDVSEGGQYEFDSEFTRETREQCLELTHLLRTTAFIHAYKSEFGTDGKSFVYKDIISNEWNSVIEPDMLHPDVVYMDYECAEKLASELNSGQVILPKSDLK